MTPPISQATINVFGTGDVCAIADVSMRQLQWWDERRILQPSYRHKHRRLYTQTDLATAWLVRALLARGVHKSWLFDLVGKIRKIAEQVEFGDRILFDGREFHIARHPEDVIRIIDGRVRPFLCVKFCCPNEPGEPLRVESEQKKRPNIRKRLRSKRPALEMFW